MKTKRKDIYVNTGNEFILNLAKKALEQIPEPEPIECALLNAGESVRREISLDTPIPIRAQVLAKIKELIESTLKTFSVEIENTAETKVPTIILSYRDSVRIETK